jgi:hypothetical protein
MFTSKILSGVSTIASPITLKRFERFNPSVVLEDIREEMTLAELSKTVRRVCEPDQYVKTVKCSQKTGQLAGNTSDLVENSFEDAVLSPSPKPSEHAVPIAEIARQVTPR